MSKEYDPSGFMRSVDELRRKQRRAASEPTGGHGCENGWRYTELGEAYRCPECNSEDALARAHEKIAASGIGERYLDTEWADLELVDPLPRIKAVAENIGAVVDSGECALFHGDPGSGKTQAAVLLVKAAILAGYTARIENLGRLALDIRDSYSTPNMVTEAATVRELSEVDLLILDDVGAGETKGAAVEQRVLYLVTEARQNAVRPTVVTTNLTPTELAKTIGKRIINRLMPLETIAFAHKRNFRKRQGSTKGAW